MKTRVSAIGGLILLFFFLTPPLFSETVTDWGGFLQSTSRAAIQPEYEFDQAVQTGLWLSTDFSDNFGLYARGSYIYNEDRPYFADIENLYARGSSLLGSEGEEYLVRYSLGRFRFSEFTGYVLNHNLDGFRLNFELPALSFEASAGYTGLTFVPSSSILVTQSDFDLQENVADHGYELSSPKLIETLKMTIPAVAFEQELILNVVLQQDLQPEENFTNTDDRIHSEHIGFGLRGGLAPSLYQNLFLYLNRGHGKYATAASLFGGGLSYYNQDFLFTRVRVRGLYSSGDNDYNFFYGGYGGERISSHFITLSSSPQFGIVFSPQIGNMSLGEISFSMRPFSKTNSRILEKFQTTLAAITFFRNTGGVISEAGIDLTSDKSYLGSEIDLSLQFRPLSDVGITLSGGLFFPNEKVFMEAYDNMKSVARLDASFRF
ncbi:MAG: hypothetical protein U5P10_10555 [Spirochaetia bacterium]|nr:hypothetical protein [Spirochaetia bacterium]